MFSRILDPTPVVCFSHFTGVSVARARIPGKGCLAAEEDQQPKLSGMVGDANKSGTAAVGEVGVRGGSPGIESPGNGPAGKGPAGKGPTGTGVVRSFIKSRPLLFVVDLFRLLR